MLKSQSPGDMFTQLGSDLGLGLAKGAGIVLVTLALAACGGGGGSDQDAGGDSDGNDRPEPDHGDNANIEQMSVRSLEAATLDSEETAVLLAPGSLFYQTVGMTQGVVALMDPMATFDQVAEDTACDISGQIKVVGSELTAVDSPYTGKLFHAETTDDRECLNGGTATDELSWQVFSNGVRVIGRPQVGLGSVGDTDTFVAYEQSGTSEAAPYSVIMMQDNERLFGWARLWTGHIKLERSYLPDSAFGDGTGSSRLFQLSHVVTGEGDEETRYNLQIGQSDAPLNYRYTVPVDELPTSYRYESFAGAYGWLWDTIGGQPVPDTCPGGRLRVYTNNLQVTPLPDGEDGILINADEVRSGTVTLDDDSGNRAIVIYDGDLNSVSVSLNGELAKSFSYEQINNLFMNRCFTTQ